MNQGKPTEALSYSDEDTSQIICVRGCFGPPIFWEGYRPDFDLGQIIICAFALAVGVLALLIW